MQILLDTHVWLWSVGDPLRLRHQFRRELENQANELWLSPISIWEVLMLTRKRRIALDVEPEAWITRSLRFWPLKEAAFTHEVAQHLSKLELPHRDPADHFLVATAKVFGLTLATSDELLLKTREIDVLKA